MSKFEIRRLSTGMVIYEDEAYNFFALVQAAVHARANLYGADLSRANLSHANLSGANTTGSNLSGANLYGADMTGSSLSRADMFGANLSRANLSRANLSGADLSRASLSHTDLYGADMTGSNLSHADLSRADMTGSNLSDVNLYGADMSGSSLSRANLSGANLSGANLTGSNLSGVNLSRANLSGAYLTDVNNADLIFAQLSIVPEHGPFFAWKKCRDKVLVRLFIPSKAKRSNATGRKCRAERAKVLEVIGAEVGVSLHDKNFTYKVGQWVRSDKWDDNRWEVCSSGIHFFLTRVEAENYE